MQTLNLGNTNITLQTFILKSSIYIPNTSITNLNLTNYPQLRSLTANYSLSNLQLIDLPNLTFLDCSKNKLNSINLTNYPLLNEVICNSNQPTTTTFPLNLNLPSIFYLACLFSLNRL